MAFELPITIKEAINNIDKRNYFLPAIQREFVWKTEQIEKLFDSILREYPISSFLFWQVEKDCIDKYNFYEFLRNYHEKNNIRNIQANINNDNDIIAILDGQQRLTSLYIALKGSYAYRIPRGHWNNESSFPCRHLYLNLLKVSADSDLIYDFQFLTDEEATKKDDSTYWFRVSDVLNIKEESEIQDYIYDHNLNTYPDQSTNKFISRTLFKLFTVINKTPIINFYLVKENDVDKVLDIFVRVNNGGTKLNRSDLLLSMASAQWNFHDARQEITQLVDEINKIGDGFGIDKDFVMRTCLVICEIGDFSVKVENFSKDKMEKIENKWDEIQESIRLSFQLLNVLGYSRDTITSNTAISIIAYYLHKIGNPKNFSTKTEYTKDRANIKKFLTIVMLKHTFGGQIEKAIRNMCDVIKTSAKNGSEFPLDDIINKQKGTDKILTFEETDLENILRYQYGKPLTYSILALLYPTLDYRNKFHQDHIHPKSMIDTDKKLYKLGVSPEDIDFYKQNYNTIANLQLLEGTINEEKSSQPFESWFNRQFTTVQEQKEYKAKNYIPDCKLDILHFKEFITERSKLIKNQLKEILQN